MFVLPPESSGQDFSNELTEYNSRRITIQKTAMLALSGWALTNIAAGGYLWERGIRKDNKRLLGYGPSLILQGGFLLVFDAVVYGMHKANNQKLRELLENITFSGSSISVSVIVEREI